MKIETAEISLRDWFAGKALAVVEATTGNATMSAEEIALAAYQIADAMMAERERTSSTSPVDFIP